MRYDCVNDRSEHIPCMDLLPTSAINPFHSPQPFHKNDEGISKPPSYSYRYLKLYGETHTIDSNGPDHLSPSTTEARLIQALRHWQSNPQPIPTTHSVVDVDLPDSELSRGEIQDREILQLVEGFICGALHAGPKPLRHWWSDGILCLHIEATGNDCLKLLGVTWIASDGLAPFEIDVELNPDDEREFRRTVFRLGCTDTRGRPILATSTRHALEILANRPRELRDWAVAIELTPP